MYFELSLKKAGYKNIKEMEIKTEKEEEKKGEMVFMPKSNLGTCTLPPRGQ